jgi:hypothetical protein
MRSALRSAPPVSASGYDVCSELSLLLLLPLLLQLLMTMAASLPATQTFCLLTSHRTQSTTYWQH